MNQKRFRRNLKLFARLMPANKQNYQIERVKFGVPLSEVCTIYNDIPGPLLILILKLNKEAPYKKDVFRAPGHHSNMKKLITCLEQGRLVNIDHYTVYTIASVLKKFLSNLPGGLFSMENESQLFKLVKSTELDLNEKQERISKLINNLPIVNQHLLVLLFGTFNTISTAAGSIGSGMSSEALGVSVAPSFFHSCVPLGCKVARMEDVQTFKLATLATQFLIDNFGVNNLFGNENYNYYCRISGRILRRRDNWIYADKYPYTNRLPIDCRLTTSLTAGASNLDELCNLSSASNSKKDLQQQKQIKATSSKDRHDCLDSDKLYSYPQHHSLSYNPNYQTTSSTTHSPPHLAQEQQFNSLTDDVYGRLSMSLEDNVFKANSLIGGVYSSTNSPCNVSTTSTSPSQLCSPVGDNLNLSDIYDQRQISLPLHYSQYSPLGKERQFKKESSIEKQNQDAMIEEEIKNLDQLKTLNIFAESTKSLTYLPIVHERQTARMRNRSEWFLTQNEQQQQHSAKSDDDLCMFNQYPGQSKLNQGTSSNFNNGTRSIIRKTSSKDKRIVRRSSSKKDKENGNQQQQQQPQQRTFGVLSTDNTSLNDDKTKGSSYKPRL